MTAALSRFLALFGAVALLASCSGPFFSKVEIKAAPTVYAALGQAKAQVSDFLGIQDIRDALKDNPDVKVYDYQDASGDQKYLVHYPITSVDLDFGSYLKDQNLDGQLTQALAPGTFTIPNLNQTVHQSGSFDLNGTLRTQVNTAFGTTTTSYPETGIATPVSLPAGTLPNVALSLTTFDTATFSAGNLELAFAMPGASSGLVLTAQIALMDGATLLTQTSGPVDITGGETAFLPLAGVTLPQNFQVRFTASTSGSSAAGLRTINVTPTLSTNVALSAATGLDLTSTSVTVNPVTVPLNGSTQLVSATVGTGSITIRQAPLWPGFTRTTSLTITQAGNGTIASAAGQTTDDIVLDLTGKTLTNADLTVTATTSVSAANGTLTGLSAGMVSLGVDAVVDIGLFSTIRVEPGTDFKRIQNFHEPISQQMKDWIDVIRFTEVGIKFQITNGLPAGNTMTIALKSDAFAIPYGSPVSLLGGGATTTATFTNTSGLNFVPTVPTDLDFEVTITPNGWSDGQFDLVNIVPGTSFSMTGTVELVFDWSDADVSPPAGTGYAGTFPSAGKTVDLSFLNDYLGTGLTLDTVPAYLSLSGLHNAVMKTSLSAKYAGGTGVAVLIGTPVTLTPLVITPANLAVADTGPTFDADGDGIVSTWDSGAAQASFDLKTILNAKPADLSLDYSLDLASSVNVVNDPNQPAQKVQADLILELPVSMVATDAGGGMAQLKVGNLMPDTDLFGRTAGGDNANIDSLLDKLVSMTLNVAVTNTTGLVGQADLVQAPGFSKSFTLPATTGTVRLNLDKAEILYIKNTIPFAPTLAVGVPGSPAPGTTYKLKRGGGLTATITVSAAADIDQTYDLRGNN